MQNLTDGRKVGPGGSAGNGLSTGPARARAIVEEINTCALVLLVINCRLLIQCSRRCSLRFRCHPSGVIIVVVAVPVNPQLVTCWRAGKPAYPQFHFSLITPCHSIDGVVVVVDEHAFCLIIVPRKEPAYEHLRELGFCSLQQKPHVLDYLTPNPNSSGLPEPGTRENNCWNGFGPLLVVKPKVADRNTEITRSTRWRSTATGEFTAAVSPFVQPVFNQRALIYERIQSSGFLPRLVDL